jgi:hypothetical protein
MAMLLSLDGEIETKLEKYGRVITEAESDSAKADAEIKRLTKRKKSIDNNVSRMYTWLENAFIIHGMQTSRLRRTTSRSDSAKAQALKCSTSLLNGVGNTIDPIC